jgi:hypothetical protein
MDSPLLLIRSFSIAPRVWWSEFPYAAVNALGVIAYLRAHPNTPMPAFHLDTSRSP